jgi:hypothetical protein
MAVNIHPTGGHRAYKKIHGIEHQFYSFNEDEAHEKQREFEAKSRLANALKAKNMFAKCGRLIGLRVRKYKKTNKITFQLQVSVNGKQKKIESLYKLGFEAEWCKYLKLWQKHFGLSAVDLLDDKKQLIIAKRLYMQDVFNLETK